MKFTALSTALALPAIALPAIALGTALSANVAVAETQEGAYLGKTGAEISQTLEQDGYKVRKVEDEDGYLEAYALLDGQRFEIYVDPKTGKVVKVEADD